MALDAVHIRAQSRSPDESNLEINPWQRQLETSVEHNTLHLRRSSSLSPRPIRRPVGRRPGLGSSSLGVRQEDADQEWQLLHTGESLASKALRMRHRFVKATYLSDPTQPAPESVSPNLEKQSAAVAGLNTASNEGLSLLPGASRASKSSLARLYSQLAKDMAISNATQTQVQPSATAMPPTVDSGNELVQRNELDQAHQRAHRHRHHPEAWRRSEWFISRALTKMRHTQHNTSSETGASALQAVNNDKNGEEPPTVTPSWPARRQRCPRCGDALPSNASPEEMARHRQSIGHRLGLNAPVSSASASEAPSPTASEAPTPELRSRSTSPTVVLPLNASMQARHRSSDRLPRRLSNAPRWKKIARDNVGHNILTRMGWKEGMGLGVQEWKLQHNRREKVKRQRLNAIRALLQRHASATSGGSSMQAPFPPYDSQEATARPVQHEAEPGTDTKGMLPPQTADSQPESEWMHIILQTSASVPAEPLSLQAAFPFELDGNNDAERRGAAQARLSNLTRADAEWLQCLTVEETNVLEPALLSGQITLQDLQSALWNSTEGNAFRNISGEQPHPEAAGTEMETSDDATRSNALLYPVEVQLRTGRSGIGSDRPLPDGRTDSSHRRRSRDSEGSVEIRRQSSPSTGEHIGASKRSRSVSSRQSAKPPGQSRSHPGVANSANLRRHSRHVESTRRQRELAYQKEKQDWLDLRASLS